jgi:hypothetical protein
MKKQAPVRRFSYIAMVFRELIQFVVALKPGSTLVTLLNHNMIFLKQIPSGQSIVKGFLL